MKTLNTNIKVAKLVYITQECPYLELGREDEQKVETPKLSKPTSTRIKTKLLTRSTIFLKGARQEDASKSVNLNIFE